MDPRNTLRVILKGLTGLRFYRARFEERGYKMRTMHFINTWNKTGKQ